MMLAGVTGCAIALDALKMMLASTTILTAVKSQAAASRELRHTSLPRAMPRP